MDSAANPFTEVGALVRSGSEYNAVVYVHWPLPLATENSALEGLLMLRILANMCCA